MSRSWLVLEYSQASPFSLRLSVATTAAAVTALVPSPASVKLAFVDATFQLLRKETEARRVFDWIKGREVRVRVPEAVVVQKTFGRLLVPWEAPKTAGANRSEAREQDLAMHTYPFKRTISFLEIAYWSGPIQIALDSTGLTDEARALLVKLAGCVGHFGKRGSFVALREVTETNDDAVTCASHGFSRRRDQIETDGDWPIDFIQRPADDLGPHAEFDNLSVASPKKRVRVGSVGDLPSPMSVDRFVGLPFVLPMRMWRSGKSFACFVRTTPGAPS